MTIAERKRHCPYHGKLFKTQEQFTKHWAKCNVRIKEGYISRAPRDKEKKA